METLSYFFIFFARYSVKLGEDLAVFTCFWGFGPGFNETSTGFKFLSPKTREYRQILAEFY